MPKNPLEIITETIIILIRGAIEGILLILQKLIELFVSLAFIAGKGIQGLIIASVIGGLVIFFVVKYLFGATVSLVKIILIYVILVIILIVFVL